MLKLAPRCSAITAPPASGARPLPVTGVPLGRQRWHRVAHRGVQAERSSAAHTQEAASGDHTDEDDEDEGTYAADEFELDDIGSTTHPTPPPPPPSPTEWAPQPATAAASHPHQLLHD